MTEPNYQTAATQIAEIYDDFEQLKRIALTDDTRPRAVTLAKALWADVAALVGALGARAIAPDDLARRNLGRTVMRSIEKAQAEKARVWPLDVNWIARAAEIAVESVARDPHGVDLTPAPDLLADDLREILRTMSSGFRDRLEAALARHDARVAVAADPASWPEPDPFVDAARELGALVDGDYAVLVVAKETTPVGTPANGWRDMQPRTGASLIWDASSTWRSTRSSPAADASACGRR